MDSNKYTSVFDQIGKFLIDIAKGALNNLIAPAGIVALIVVLIIQIMGLVSLHRQGSGSEIGHKIPALVVTVIALGLLGTYSTWAWGLI